MWIARDKDGSLFLFNSKPTLGSANTDDAYWRASSNTPIFYYYEDAYDVVEPSGVVELDKKAFPEVTFENSPKELIVK